MVDDKEKKHDASEPVGTVYSNISNASTIYGEEKFNAVRGHGFAAERANTLHDKLTGHDAKIIGDDNVKNGADRILDGVNIQSKYCSSGGKCISECFEDGNFRYWNSDGTPMQIEVPSDKYESAVQAMQDRIRKGQVAGVTNPEEAENIVRQGKFSYEQVKNIAKAGTVESITYDAANGAVIATTTFGITSALAFATSVWNGENLDSALKYAAMDGLKVGGTSFVSAILAGQLTKAGLNSFLVGGSDAVVKILGSKGSAVLANAFRGGQNIYGAAAMKSVSKMLRGNLITGVASVVVLSSGDVVNIFRGRISGRQLLKNTAGTVSSVVGGTAGWVGGATAGAAIGSVVPVVGTAIGGLVGGIAGAFGGGTLASGATKKCLDNFIEDDADKMVRKLEAAFIELMDDYILTQNEVESIVSRIGTGITGKDLKDMYAKKHQKRYAKGLIRPIIEDEISHREKVQDVSRKDMQRGLRMVLEDIADSEEYKTSMV